jgi:lipid II:glycine glycyltransferase (peptidoglycan interpeptide bridge formation enzyme)
MEIREVSFKEKALFNKLTTHPVQSWEWGDFREEAGNKVLRLGVYEEKKLTEVYLMTVHHLPKTKYFVAMCAKCPAPSSQVLKYLKEYVKTHNIIMIRMEPNVSVTEKGAQRLLHVLKTNGAKPGRPFFNKSTFCIDLTKTEEELQKAMHSKTRYNIRVASRYKVEVVEDNSDKAFDKYLDLMDETTRRQQYFNHTERYHRLMWKTFKESGIAHLLCARYNGKTLITWVLFEWHDTLYYPYGASSVEDRNVMAAYGMMWNAILFGKSRGLKKFDLWGRDEGKGFTRFKEGFNPQIIEYLGTWDIPINPHLHKIYRLLEEARWVLLKARAKLVPASSFR